MVRTHVHKQIKKRRYEKENPGRFVFGKPVLFTLGLGLTTPYSLSLFVWDFHQTFVVVCIEFWLRFERQIRPIRLAINFLLITARDEGKVRLCVKLFYFFRVWILIRLTWNLSRFVSNSVEILTWNFRKKLFRENFSEIFEQTKPILYKNLWNFPHFLKFLFRVRIALKKFTQVLSYVVFTQLRRHVHKQITKRRYGKEKSWGFVFGKTNLFTLGLDLLRLTPWVFWSEIFARLSSLCLLSFGWDLSTRLHKTTNKLFIGHCQGWKASSFVCEIVRFFSWVNSHSFDLKFVAFFHEFSGDSYVEFQEKTISGEFFRNFHANQGYLNLWNFALLFVIFILGLYCAEKIHTSTFICFLHPGKEARP